MLAGVDTNVGAAKTPRLMKTRTKEPTIFTFKYDMTKTDLQFVLLYGRKLVPEQNIIKYSLFCSSPESGASYEEVIPKMNFIFDRK